MFNIEKYDAWLIWYSLLCYLFTHVLKILGTGALRSDHQVTKSGTMSGPNFNYLYAPVPPTVSDHFLSNFQDMLSLPSCTTYRPFFFVSLT